MPTYSRADRLSEIKKVGFPDPLTALAVSLAEFGENRDYVTQSQSDSRYANGEQEQSYGPWQIHLPAHPDVAQSCAMDLSCSTQKAFDISKGGTDFGAWSAFTSGSYSRFLPELQNLTSPSPAASGTTSGGSNPSSSPSSSPDLPPDLLSRIRMRLGQLLVLRNHGGINEAGIASTLQSEFPQVSNAALLEIIRGTSSSATSNINNAPVVGGGVQTADKAASAIQSAGTSLDFLKGLFASENIWRVGFVVLGGLMVIFGARLYFHQDTGSEQVRGTA